MNILKNQKVLVIGDIMLDTYIDGKAERISPEAPVPVLSVKSTKHCLGGAGNVVSNITTLESNARLLTCFGNDTAGNMILILLNKDKVDIEYIKQYENIDTIQKVRLVSKHHQLIRYDIEKIEPICNDYGDLIKKNINNIFYEISSVIISDYGKGMITEYTAQTIIEEANKRKIPIVVDPKGISYNKYRGATICKPNMKEFIEISGSNEDISEDEILSYGISIIDKYKFKYLLITRAEKGITLIKDKQKYDFSALTRDVSDVTGAGDTVAAVFTMGLGAGIPIDECCRLANKAAAIAVSKFGSATVSPQELFFSDKLMASGSLLANELRSQNKKIVFTNGCFDIIHAGHIKSFEITKSFGDILIVGLNSDRSIKAIKGESRPIISQNDRVKLLCAISCIDYVIVFDEDTPEQLIKEILPDVLVKGADWRGKPVAGQEIVEKNGGQLEFIELEQDLSTSLIIERIKSSGHL